MAKKVTRTQEPTPQIPTRLKVTPTTPINYLMYQAFPERPADDFSSHSNEAYATSVKEDKLVIRVVFVTENGSPLFQYGKQPLIALRFHTGGGIMKKEVYLPFTVSGTDRQVSPTAIRAAYARILTLATKAAAKKAKSQARRESKKATKLANLVEPFEVTKDTTSFSILAAAYPDKAEALAAQVAKDSWSPRFHEVLPDLRNVRIRVTTGKKSYRKEFLWFEVSRDGVDYRVTERRRIAPTQGRISLAAVREAIETLAFHRRAAEGAVAEARVQQEARQAIAANLAEGFTAGAYPFDVMVRPSKYSSTKFDLELRGLTEAQVSELAKLYTEWKEAKQA